METALPELPAQADVLKRPVRDDFEKKMRDLDKRAEVLKVSVEANRYKRRQVYEGGKVEGGDVTYRELLATNIEAVKKVRSERREHLDQLTALKERQRELDNEKAGLMKNVPRNYHTQQDLQQAIQEKQ